MGRTQVARRSYYHHHRRQHSHFEAFSACNRSLTTITEAARALKDRDITADQLLDSCLKRREEIQGLNCFVTEQRPPSIGVNGSHNTPSALMGIPVAVKDNFCTAGVRTTASSRMLANFVPPYTATCVERLQAAGAVSVGKTNMDEFGMGSATIYSHFGDTINPWSPPESSLR